MLAAPHSYEALTGGFLLGLSFIFSIGPQNLKLIEAGAFRDNPMTIATTGYVSEVVIVTASLAGLGLSAESVAGVGFGIRVLGICFLVTYGLCAIFGSLPHMTGGSQKPFPRHRLQAIRSMLAATWLNPLVYVEIGFLVSVVASGFGQAAHWPFGFGFLAASAIRFYGWSLAGAFLNPWLAGDGWRLRFRRISGILLLCSAGLLLSRTIGET